MSVFLEWKKVKRTGFLPTFLCGGILASVIPIVNMAVRSEIYQTKQGTPVQILLDANWQMMAMLNLLLVIAGACLLYHTEYADHAMQKLNSLPIPKSSVFFGKMMMLIFMDIMVLAIEAGAITFCSVYWFEAEYGLWADIWKNFGYIFLLMQPCAVLSLLLSQACKNMWVSLGIGVICVFIATMLPTDNYVLSLFPFATPFQIFEGTSKELAMHYILAAVAEVLVFGLTELVYLKVRRSFE